MSVFIVKPCTDVNALPRKELLSAVFLIGIQGSKILAIQNDRGWEIPGGHIEEGETHKEALIREVKEEAGATFTNSRLACIIESTNQDKYKDKVMLIYTTESFELGVFTPSEDALDREVIEISEFLSRHGGGIDMKMMIEESQKVLSRK